ncbi:MAG TPA: UDP-3-O-acyl-N-acetylglucosamine deacetylase [Rhabdochlamydiaceae bacterium]|nr:UDP-3-O-acyl-N-acetylglucosamine deacetylase [Rhabdochlamydiaceae bacterium]
MQKTLSRKASVSGVGLFTGEKVSLTLCPAPANSGIVFERVDLPGKPEIPAHLSFVREAPRCTRLASEKGSIFMVEHLLSALYSMQVDNVRVEVQGPEIPAGDGSAKIFVDLIEKIQLKSLGIPRQYARISQPLFWSEGEVHLIALPCPEFRLSYTMHYPQSTVLRSQYYSLSLNPKRFVEEIASCRTFSLYEDILPFIEKGIIKGGGLENALIIKGDQILNPEGARFPDEMVRHKILDLIGDLALIGAPLHGHIIAVRSGHASNVAFAKLLAKTANLESC